MLFFSAMSTVALRRKLGSDRVPTQRLSTNKVNVTSRTRSGNRFLLGQVGNLPAQEFQTLVYAKGKT